MAKSANGSKSTPRDVMRSIKQLHGNAAPEPNQGKRTADSGDGGCARITGRGTMEKK